MLLNGVSHVSILTNDTERSLPSHSRSLASIR